MNPKTARPEDGLMVGICTLFFGAVLLWTGYISLTSIDIEDGVDLLNTVFALCSLIALPFSLYTFRVSYESLFTKLYFIDTDAYCESVSFYKYRRDKTIQFNEVEACTISILKSFSIKVWQESM